MIQIELVRQDVIEVAADVLILKHARSFHGADESVHLRLVQGNACDAGSVHPEDGESVLIPTNGSIAANHVLFLGTPGLRDFRYREIRLFARRAIERLAASGLPIKTIATTVHGAGYGLDVEESFQAMVLGLQQGLTAHPIANLQKVVFVERHLRRHELLESAMSDVHLVMPSVSAEGKTPAQPIAPEPVIASKKTVFVAMPFSENFEDVYQFGIYQTVRKLGLVCEKVDESIYAGSIVDRIVLGIQNCEFLIADLTEERPNVYLEVGYAWGLRKPVLLVAREGQRLHFDLSHHKCLFYSTIGKLADQLERTIPDLIHAGQQNG